MADPITTSENGTRKTGARKKAGSPDVSVEAMADVPVSTTADEIGEPADGIAAAKSRFSKAIEEAKAGAEALKGEAMGRTAAYKSKVAGTTGDWTEEARVYANQAREKGAALADEGKAKATDALAALGRTIAETAPTIDEKLGSQYGDYARNAARTVQDAAAKLEAKDLGELGDDVKELVRKSPAAAIGIAAVAGFVVARLFRGSDD